MLPLLAAGAIAQWQWRGAMWAIALGVLAVGLSATLLLRRAPAMFIPFAHLSAAARDLGIADAQAVGLAGLIGVGSLTGRFVIGAVADRLGRPLTVFVLWMGLSYGGAVSSIIGTLYTGAALGNVAGPWVAGRVFDAMGSHAPVIVGCALLSLLATVAAWRAVAR